MEFKIIRVWLDNHAFRARRIKEQISQHALARQIGVPQCRICNFELDGSRDSVIGVRDIMAVLALCDTSEEFMSYLHCTAKTDNGYEFSCPLSAFIDDPATAYRKARKLQHPKYVVRNLITQQAA